MTTKFWNLMQHFMLPPWPQNTSTKSVLSKLNLFQFTHLSKTITGGTRWRIWLSHCATSRKNLCLTPGRVIGIFYWLNPSGRTTALGWTQPLTEMSTRDLSGGKGGRCVRLRALPPLRADCLEILGASVSRIPVGLYRDSLTSLLLEWYLF